MTTIETVTTPHGFAVLVEALWQGALSEHEFIKQAHQTGASVARIEYAIEELKAEDGVQ